ncbi:dihydrofolate reductase family protein [uncultured Bacteroides sp.]|uniref:dihydrofolate reductase family protein n=1 Tax=uncultured Bacteroides sp. TaxID=162156 RepID=UPI002AAAC252|nr:dihydrofolate reductase family protein [uncultured Bacteroides sp.]
MRKIKLYIAASLDGYIARSNGDIDWLTEFPNPEKNDYEYQTFFESVGIVIMGGRTYRDILNMDVVWPYQAKNTYVITHHSLAPEKNIQFITHDIVEIITQMRNENGKDIWLVGGGEIISMLLNHELIDEMIITTIPIILGDGIALFSKVTKESQWEVFNYHKYENGVMLNHYKIKR